MKPKEDPEDRKARLRERRMSMIERRQASEQSSASLTSDLRAVYGLQNLYNFGQKGSFSAPSTPTQTGTPWSPFISGTR